MIYRVFHSVREEANSLVLAPSSILTNQSAEATDMKTLGSETMMGEVLDNCDGIVLQRRIFPARKFSAHRIIVAVNRHFPLHHDGNNVKSIRPDQSVNWGLCVRPALDLHVTREDCGARGPRERNAKWG